MAYQNVKNPRFYISWGDYWRSIGASIPPHNTIRPMETQSITLEAGGDYYKFMDPHSYPPTDSAPKGINWYAVLNHNLTPGFEFIVKQYANDGTNESFIVYDKAINIEGSEPGLMGFSLGTRSDAFTDMEQEDVNIQTGIGTVSDSPVEANITFQIGCMVYGQYFDMPHSPDMSLTLTHSWGIKTTETKGGASLSNAMWTKPPKWGDREAWQLGDFPYYYSGRRTWSLSFSEISDSDMEPYNYYGVLFDTDTGTPSVTRQNDPNWFQSVLYYTNGGQLPFIFNPDSSIEYYQNNEAEFEINKTPRVPEFAICKFDMNSFKRTQTSFNRYTIKIIIREVW